jgi:hypothetical protein
MANKKGFQFLESPFDFPSNANDSNGHYPDLRVSLYTILAKARNMAVTMQQNIIVNAFILVDRLSLSFSYPTNTK